jgi:hypothetical protein
MNIRPLNLKELLIMNRITSIASALLLTGFAGLAVADDAAPRALEPMAFTSSLSRATVSSDARQGASFAPLEHSDGTAAPAPSVRANSRALVQADTTLWMRSGLATLQLGEAGADMSSPAYRRAVAAYSKARSVSGSSALVDGLERGEGNGATKSALR